MADTIRQPIRWMRENVFVTRDGVAYGIWQLDGQQRQSYRLQRAGILQHHEELPEN